MGTVEAAEHHLVAGNCKRPRVDRRIAEWRGSAVCMHVKYRGPGRRSVRDAEVPARSVDKSTTKSDSGRWRRQRRQFESPWTRAVRDPKVLRAAGIKTPEYCFCHLLPPNMPIYFAPLFFP